jgi:hypothetical protein
MLLFLTAATPLTGQELRNLRINGFGGWSYGRTDQNRLLGAEPNGEYSRSQLALKATGTAIPSVQINAQVFFRTGIDGSEARVDYAFADWELANAFHVRFGKAKHPFGIYSEVAGLGTVRPFLNLPQAVYGPIGLVSRAYNGIGVQGDIALGQGWSLVYDAYAGGIDFEQEESALSLFAQPGVDQSLVVDIFKSEDVFGSRLQLGTPINGLRAGASFYSGRPDLPAEQDPVRFWTWGLQGEYVIDRTWIRAELVRQRDRLPALQDTETAYYVELAQFLTDQIQVAAQASRLKADVTLPDPLVAPAEVTEHEEFTLGVNYWVSPEFGIKSSIHWTSGNLIAELSPEDYVVAILQGASPRPNTRLFQLGAQFSF